jgi:hypothetical protein
VLTEQPDHIAFLLQITKPSIVAYPWRISAETLYCGTGESCAIHSQAENVELHKPSLYSLKAVVLSTKWAI